MTEDTTITINPEMQPDDCNLIISGRVIQTNDGRKRRVLKYGIIVGVTLLITVAILVTIALALPVKYDDLQYQGSRGSFEQAGYQAKSLLQGALTDALQRDGMLPDMRNTRFPFN